LIAPLMQKELERNGTADRLLQVLKENKFVLYCQAIRPLAPACHASPYQEIFVRFVEEDQKLLPPGTFIPVLEHYELMAVLDRWVVNRVIGWLRGRGGWEKDRDPRCSINLSGESVQNVELARFIQRQLEACRVPPAALSFEIAEADFVEHVGAVADIISMLGPLGCGFALSGYSGAIIPCGTLKEIGFDAVKIDGDIIRRIHRDRFSLALAKMIIDRCRELGMFSVGECVENPEILETLRALRADYAQGFGIERPGPLEKA